MSNLLRQSTLWFVTILLALANAACAKSGTPIPATTELAVSSTPLAVTDSAPASASAPPTQRPAATPDMTETAIQAFVATADTVGTEVAAQGGDSQNVVATLGALSLYQSPTPFTAPTATPLPFPVNTEQIQTNGVTYTRFTFADPQDLQAARQAYERYFDFISFRAGPPPDDIQNALTQYMVQSTHLQDPGSCYLADVQHKVLGLTAGGRYVRITAALPHWDNSQVFLDVTATEITVAMAWEAKGALLELVDGQSGAVVRQQSNTTLSGTARLIYDSARSQWLVQDDDHGFYCNGLQFFLD